MPKRKIQSTKKQNAIIHTQAIIHKQAKDKQKKQKGQEKHKMKEVQKQDNKLPKMNNQVIKTAMKQNHMQTTNRQVKE